MPQYVGYVWDGPSAGKWMTADSPWMRFVVHLPYDYSRATPVDPAEAEVPVTWKESEYRLQKMVYRNVEYRIWLENTSPENLRQIEISSNAVLGLHRIFDGSELNGE